MRCPNCQPNLLRKGGGSLGRQEVVGVDGGSFSLSSSSSTIIGFASDPHPRLSKRESGEVSIRHIDPYRDSPTQIQCLTNLRSDSRSCPLIVPNT